MCDGWRANPFWKSAGAGRKKILPKCTGYPKLRVSNILRAAACHFVVYDYLVFGLTEGGESASEKPAIEEGSVLRNRKTALLFVRAMAGC